MLLCRRKRKGVEYMPYENLNDLPVGVKNHVPEHGQEIYKEAFNSAWQQYKDAKKRYHEESREEAAHRVAWAAVKHVYKKQGEKWVKKA